MERLRARSVQKCFFKRTNESGVKNLDTLKPTVLTKGLKGASCKINITAGAAIKQLGWNMGTCVTDLMCRERERAELPGLTWKNRSGIYSFVFFLFFFPNFIFLHHFLPVCRIDHAAWSNSRWVCFCHKQFSRSHLNLKNRDKSGGRSCSRRVQV